MQELKCHCEVHLSRFLTITAEVYFEIRTMGLDQGVDSRWRVLGN